MSENNVDGRYRLLFVEEVAELLRRSPNQIRWMINQGTAPKYAKIAGRIVFREVDVFAFIDEAFGPEINVDSGWDAE